MVHYLFLALYFLSFLALVTVIVFLLRRWRKGVR